MTAKGSDIIDNQTDKGRMTDVFQFHELCIKNNMQQVALNNFDGNGSDNSYLGKAVS